MEVTSLGIIWLFLLILSLFNARRLSVFLLVLSCVFQATAILNIGNKGYSPFVFAQIFFIIRNIRALHMEKLFLKIPDRGFRFLFYFFIVGSIFTFITPFLFEGIKVYIPELGIDDNYYFGGKPLLFTVGNVIQVLYLFFNITTLYILYKIRSEELFKTALFSFLISIGIVLIVGFWEFISKQFGLIYFPSKFFLNNSIYAILNDQEVASGLKRLNSTFIEPSFAGGFLAASFWALFSIKKYWSNILCIVTFIALCFNLSGTGIVAFIGGGAICLLYSKKTYWIPFVIFGCVFFFLATWLHYDTLIADMLLNKSSSGSGINRQGSNYFSLHVFVQTFGLGVGLGSHRASGFFFNLLANAGVASGFLFAYLFITFRKLRGYIKIDGNIIHLSEYNGPLFIFNFSIVLIIAQFIAIPDLSLPIFWMWQYVYFLYPNIKLNASN